MDEHDVEDSKVQIDSSSEPYLVEDDQEDDGSGDDDDADDDDNDPTEAVAGQVKLVPSLFGESRTPTIHFDYPAELKLSRDPGFFVVSELGKQRRLAYVTKWERNCVKNAFARAGFERLTGSDPKGFNGYWGKHLSHKEIAELNRFQKVNHFPGSWNIGRKDRLARTLLACKRRHGAEHFNFHPDVFHLPGERRMLELKIKADKSIFIIKPNASSCGRGIRLIHKDNLPSIDKKKSAIVQKYLDKPHLIDGYKYDLRLYVVVTSTDPLRVYLFQHGLARFSTAKYTLRNLSSRFAHLTNYSINKKSDKFVEPTDNHAANAESTGGGGGGGAGHAAAQDDHGQKKNSSSSSSSSSRRRRDGDR